MASPPSCTTATSLPAALLTSTICIGMVISYLPQHLRIIRARSSEGFSPWYLLLGATSSASGMLNLWILQWPLIRCCRVVSAKACIGNMLGLVQVTLQWVLFSIVLILYLAYFPSHLKYCRTLPLPATRANDDALAAHASDAAAAAAADTSPSTDERIERQPLLGASQGLTVVKYTTTAEWRIAVILAMIVLIHLSLLTVLAITLLHILPTSPTLHPLTQGYATLLGTSSALLAICQYAPQLVHTFRTRLVGALSIGTMVIQVPGSIAFVASLVGREGVQVSTWASYAITGAMQAALLGMCLAWKKRQARLGIDDFGRPVDGDPVEERR
ncbi:hypothetical protein NliqN6_4252 [Naganishia liquefaciens]|uniref:PQ loop repeat protein n=1 Tax=Naganishia liquefaciens TaxID=104408 RepID=A0A8H3YFL0_9TREE|nr:hypothetical protein NliqN6_4252 [Naganishia liquefaciens]